MRKFVLVVLLTGGLTAAFFRGAFIRATPISEISSRPGEFEGKRVKVRGIVEASTKLPIMTQRFYLLRDGDSRLPVVSYAELPTEGKEVAVVGTLSSAAIIGGMSAGIHLTVGNPAR